jgi:hypothetical protein
MFDALVQKNPALLIPILSIIGTALVFLVWIFAHYWAKVRRMELEAALKKEMLNRGLGAADIERVLAASSAARPADLPAEKETISDNEYYLVEKMLDEGRPVEEIERLVRAFKTGETPRIRSLERVMQDRG